MSRNIIQNLETEESIPKEKMSNLFGLRSRWYSGGQCVNVKVVNVSMSKMKIRGLWEVFAWEVFAWASDMIQGQKIVFEGMPWVLSILFKMV